MKPEQARQMLPLMLLKEAGQKDGCTAFEYALIRLITEHEDRIKALEANLRHTQRLAMGV